MIGKPAIAIAISLLGVVRGSASAGLVPLVNADFEQGSPAPPTAVAGGDHYIGNIPGWDVVNLGGVFKPDYGAGAYPAGVQATTGQYTAYSEDNAWGLITLLLPAEYTYQAGVSYTLSVDIGARLNQDFGAEFGFFRLENPFPTVVAVKSATNPGAGNFTRQSITINGSSLQPEDLGDRIRIGFYALPDDVELDINYFADFDNVTLDISNVPEPATAMTLLAALGFLVSRLRPNRHDLHLTPAA